MPGMARSSFLVVLVLCELGQIPEDEPRLTAERAAPCPALLELLLAQLELLVSCVMVSFSFLEFPMSVWPVLRTLSST